MKFGKHNWVMALFLAVAGSQVFGVAMANEDDGTQNTFWQDRAAKKKASTTTTKKAAPKKAAAPKTTTTTRRTTNAAPVRRLTAETAPSGMPAADEMRFIMDEVIVRFNLGSSPQGMDRLVAQLDLAHMAVRTFRLAGATLHRYRITEGSSVPDVIAALEASEFVVYAQPNYLYTPAQDSKAKPGQYALARMAIAPISADVRGVGARLAIIDSVVDTNHPEFANAKIKTHDVSDAPNADPDAHGTGITGIAAATGTLSGIAPEAEIVAIAAFAKSDDGQTYGNSWTIGRAMDVAADNEAQVINMSFAGPRDPLLEGSVNGARKRGMVLVAAAGNDGPGAAALYPAAYGGTIGVTAIDAEDGIYANANRGAYVELAAPGVNILTAAPGGAYDFISGTSLASAHVSALAALLVGENPSITQDELASLLAETSTDLGDTGRDDVFGAGVPNAQAALAQIGG